MMAKELFFSYSKVATDFEFSEMLKSIQINGVPSGNLT